MNMVVEKRSYYVKLLLFYMLPYEVVKKANLTDFPRCAMNALCDPVWRSVYDSDHFHELIVDAYAWYLWKFLRIPGWMESYSGDDPIWLFAHNLGPIRETLDYLGPEKFIDPFVLNPRLMVPFPDDIEWIYELFVVLIDLFDEKYNLVAAIDVIKHNRTHEDYDFRRSNEKNAFYRKWYHTRAKTKVIYGEKVVEGSIVKTPSGRWRPIRELHKPSDDWTNEIFFRDFFAQCSAIDKKILVLTKMGYKKIEIAKMLGYANHTPVTKRFQRIAKRFAEYEDQN